MKKKTLWVFIIYMKQNNFGEFLQNILSFSVNLLFLKSGKKWTEKLTSTENQLRRRNDGAKFVGMVKVERRRRQACGCNMLHAADCYMCCFNAFFFKVKKFFFHTFDQNLRFAWRNNKKFVNRKKSLKIALKSLVAKYVGMLYYKSNK